MPQVALVQMPFGRVESPSLSLSLFKAALARREISSAVHYANLSWADQFGLDVFRLIEHTNPTQLVGEWIFAGASAEAEPPLTALAGAHPALVGMMRSLHPMLDLRALLREARLRAAGFIESCARRVLAGGPRVVACSSTFQQHCASLALLRRVKELSPATVTAVGGANCDGQLGTESARRFPFLDWVFCGEADQSFPDHCMELLRNPGSGPGPLVVRPADPPIHHDLGALPFPEFDDYFRELAATSLQPFIKPSLVLEGSRGCWWGAKHHCTFCGLSATSIGYRAKPPERLAAELVEVSRRYGVRKVQLTDNIADPKTSERLVPRLREAGLSIFIETKANLDHRQLAAMASAGMRRIQPGIESLHDGVLALMDKGTSAALNVRLLRDAQNLGVDVIWNVLFGLPGEKDEWYAQLAQWLPAIGHLRPPIGLSPVRYDRFSRYWERPGDFGLTLEAFPAYRQLYGERPEELAYFFFDSSGTTPFSFGPQTLSDGWWKRMRHERPGLDAFHQAAGRWITRYWSAQRPRLVAADRGTHLEISDTRLPAEARTHRVEGAAREVLARCRGISSRPGLIEALGLPEPELDAAIGELLERSLLLSVGGRYVTLPLLEPVVPPPAEAELPGGELNDAEAFEFYAPRSLAGQLSAAAREDLIALFREMASEQE